MKLNDELKIRVVNTDHPRQKGSVSEKLFALMGKARTVGAYREAAREVHPTKALAYLKWEVERGTVVVGKAARSKAPRKAKQEKAAGETEVTNQ